jgi:hypothetical protein
MNHHPVTSKIIATLLGLGLLLCSALLILPWLGVQAAPQPQLTPFPTPTPGADGRIVYIVQPNDTLWRISAITGVSLDQLRLLNKLGTDDTIVPGDTLLLGLAGPEVVTPTAGAQATQSLRQPTPTPRQGTGNLCIIVYDDVNGDAIRQITETWIVGGQISISDRVGDISETAETEMLYDEEGEIAYRCFEALQEGNYNITVAIPDGYNPTTVLNRGLTLRGGEETYLAFGGQANSERLAETAIIPEAPGKSPLLAIIGGLLLLVGAGLGIYVGLIYRSR